MLQLGLFCFNLSMEKRGSNASMQTYGTNALRGVWLDIANKECRIYSENDEANVPNRSGIFNIMNSTARQYERIKARFCC